MNHHSSASLSVRGVLFRLFVITLLFLPLAVTFFHVTSPASAGSCAEDPNDLIQNGTMLGGPSPYGVVAIDWNAYINTGTNVNFENPDNEGWDPNGSQYIWSDYGPFDAGIYQQVKNLTPGQTYHYWIVWGQALTDQGGGINVRTDKIDRQIGIDLTGGTDPNASTVQWTVPYWGGSGFNRIEWNQYFVAPGSTVTVFMRVVNTLTTGRNKVFFDTACLFPSSGSATTTPWATPNGTPTKTFTPTATSTTRTPTATPSTCSVNKTATITVGAHPKGLAVDPATNRVFVGLADSSSVGVIDAGANQLTATWATDGQGNTNGLGFAQNQLFVSKANNASVSILDASSGSFIKNVAVQSGPYGIGTSGSRVWVANFNDNSVSVLDASANTLLKTSAGGTNPSLVAPLANRAYVTAWDTGLLDVDSSGNVLQVIAMNPGSFGVAVNPLSNRVYVSNRMTNGLSIVDATTDSVMVNYTEAATPYALAMNPSTNRLFIVLADSNTLRVRDVNSTALIADIPLGGQGSQGGDSIAILNNKVYVANYTDGTVSVINDCASSNPPPTATRTPTKTNTPLATSTPTSTRTPPATFTPTNTRTPTRIFTASPTATALPSPTPGPTATPFVPSVFIYVPFVAR